MKKLLSIVVIVLLLGGNAYTEELNNNDQNALVEFDGICVQNIHKLDVINSYAKIQKWKDMPPDLDAMNAPQVKGSMYKSWGYQKENTTYLIAINNPENVFTCSLAAKYFDIIKFKKILSEFYPINLLNKNTQGIHIFIPHLKPNHLASPFYLS